MKYKIALLGVGLNTSGWEDVAEILTKKGFLCEIFKRHQEIGPDFELGILIGYNKIVPKEYLTGPKQGFILFHSSDLPKGRGWAPIYYTMSNELDLVQSLLYADEEVDLGNILAKARYKLSGNEMEEEVRFYDDQLTLFLLQECITEIIYQRPFGIEQNKNESTWWKKRNPEDSEVKLDQNIREIFNHIRSLPSSAPPFFYNKGRKYHIKIQVENSEKKKTIDPKILSLEKYF